MRTQLISMTALLCMTATSAIADLTISAASDGSYTIKGDISEIGSIVGDSINTATNFGLAMAEIHGGTEVDFSEGHVINQSVIISIARADGSVATYSASGPVFAYDSQNTFTETALNFSLTGVIVFRNSDGRLVSDGGTISLVK